MTNEQASALRPGAWVVVTRPDEGRFMEAKALKTRLSVGERLAVAPDVRAGSAGKSMVTVTSLLCRHPAHVLYVWVPFAALEVLS